MDWPHIKDIPVNEFGDKKIFAMAFPWLFPGGVGDVKDFDGDLGQWGKMLLFYEDGRFATDKIFCFYAMNYIIRQRNSRSGHYFVDKFQVNCPETLEDLQAEIRKGNTTFINNLTYYSKRIKGSTPYWLQKKGEVYSWINYHMARGNGVPTFFITLSCAEYFWADVIDLLKDRLEAAGVCTDNCHVGSPSLVQIANDYAVVIQEYFQQRVQIWLDTVGKRIFNIKHYWCRYEFAPGRGQIHAHMLVISKDQHIYEHAHNLRKRPDGENLRSQYLSKWAADKFGLTASVGPGFDDLEVDKTNTPVQFRFCDLGEDEHKIFQDGQKLLKFCQNHECSGFCLKSSDKG